MFWLTEGGLKLIILGFLAVMALAIIFGLVKLIREPGEVWRETRSGIGRGFSAILEYWREQPFLTRVTLPLVPVLIPIVIWVLVTEGGR